MLSKINPTSIKNRKNKSENITNIDWVNWILSHKKENTLISKTEKMVKIKAVKIRRRS